LKILQMKLFFLRENSLKVGWTKEKLSYNMDLDYTKEVLSQEITLELLVLTVLMLKLVVVLIVKILVKLDGLNFKRLTEFLMVFSDFIM
jgi:hypothetical protein